MVEDTITIPRKRSTQNGGGRAPLRASVLPQARQTNIFRSFIVVGPVSNDNQAENSDGTASVGVGSSPVRDRRGSGRAHLRENRSTDRRRVRPREIQIKIMYG